MDTHKIRIATVTTTYFSGRVEVSNLNEQDVALALSSPENGVTVASRSVAYPRLDGAPWPLSGSGLAAEWAILKLHSDPDTAGDLSWA
jgi:hypothetical protein